MSTNVVVDTNAFMNNIKLTDYDTVYIPIKVLEELDKHKECSDSLRKFKARRALRSIISLKETNKVEYLIEKKSEMPEWMECNKADNIILMYAQYICDSDKDCRLLTLDKNMVEKADALHIPILEYQDSFKENEDIEYKGYKEVFVSDAELSYLYENSDLNLYECLTNEYLIVRNLDGQLVDKLKWDGKFLKPLAYNSINNKYTGKIKPRNIQQELAFDMLQSSNSTIKVLTGNYGTGKDFLMISTALQLIRDGKYEKIMWIRNNIEVKNSKPIGFLPNGLKEKLMPFAMPMADHVGGEEGLNRLIAEDKVEVQHLGFMRGRDIKDTIIMCSEAENMTRGHVQLLIGRVGQNSTLWMNGDYKQSDDNIFENDNGLITSIDRLKGIDKFGFVKLEVVERSETSRLADLLD